MDILDELADLQRTLVVAQGDGVDGESCQLLDERDQRLEILLDGDMEGVLILEVDGD